MDNGWLFPLGAVAASLIMWWLLRKNEGRRVVNNLLAGVTSRPLLVEVREGTTFVRYVDSKEFWMSYKENLDGEKILRHQYSYDIALQLTFRHGVLCHFARVTKHTRHTGAHWETYESLWRPDLCEDAERILRLVQSTVEQAQGEPLEKQLS